MKRKLFLVLFVAVFAFSVFATGGRQPATQTSASGNPVLTATTLYFSAEVAENAAYAARVEEITGYKLDVNWVPSTSYVDVLNTMLASNSMRNITVIENLKATSFINAFDDGLFWGLSNYIRNYPNLGLLGDVRYNNVKRNGEIVGIPRARHLVRQGLIYRQDWAEALGISGQPQTLADVDRMVRGFAARNETRYGIVMGCAGVNPAIPEGIDYLAIFMGAPLNWGYNRQGQFTHAWLTDEYMQAVDQFRTWYADGLVNRNFIEINSEDAKRILNTEEAGFIFIYCDDIGNRFGDLFIKNPAARLWYAYQLNGRTFATQGFNGVLAISKNANEDILRHCLTFINNEGTVEYENFLGSGLEGQHYTMVDGWLTRTQEQNARVATIPPYNQLRPYEGVILPTLRARDTTPTAAAVQSLIDERLLYVNTAVTDPTIPYVSPTQTRIGVSDLDPIRCDAINRYIMGVIDRAAYQAAQQRWLAAGGAQVTREFEDQIRANR